MPLEIAMLVWSSAVDAPLGQPCDADTRYQRLLLSTSQFRVASIIRRTDTWRVRSANAMRNIIFSCAVSIWILEAPSDQCVAFQRHEPHSLLRCQDQCAEFQIWCVFLG